MAPALLRSADTSREAILIEALVLIRENCGEVSLSHKEEIKKTTLVYVLIFCLC